MKENRNYIWMSSKINERDSKLGGKGSFASQKIPKDELIAIFGGYILTLEEEKSLPPEVSDLAIQIEKNFVIGNIELRGLGSGDYINHSCDPNAGIRGQISLYAMRDIDEGEEITFDYGTVLFTDGSTPTYVLECNCESKNCRKTITDTDWRKPEVRSRNKKYFPFYVLDAFETI